VRPARDHVYDAWAERNIYTTTLIYSALISVLLPAFHYVLREAAPHVYDSLPLRFVCTLCAIAVACTLLFVRRARRYGELLQFAQVAVTMAVIDMLVVDSRDHYMYIASALLVIIGAQNAFFRATPLAISMCFGCLFFIAYSGVRGILWQPYNLTTIAIFATGYVLAYIPAYHHIRSRQSDIRSRMDAMRVSSELEEAHAITHLGKWSQNQDTGEVQCSAEIMRILGLPLDTPHAAMPEIYARSVHPEDREVVEAALATCDAVGKFSVDHRIVLPGGDVRWVHLSGKQQTDEAGAVVHRIGTLMDITARKEAEVSLERLARYDPLTGLPNRSLLHEQLRDTLEARTRTNGNFAVLFLDLDRFKDINDTLGHSVGDLLLREVAARIRSLVPAGTLIARWGGDEFVALLDGVDGEQSVERTCRRIVSGLATPFTIDSYEFAVMASIGVALFPQDGTDPEVLIRNADTAMYEAKEAPGQRYAFFASEMHATAAMRHHIQNQLQYAIATSSLSLYYQPIMEAERGAIVSAEALLRWTDADGRVHTPADFISIAEDTGAIVPIGAWVIEHAARQAMTWRRAGMPLRVAVNLSPRQLAHPDFSDMLAHILRITGVEPSLLEVEITESGLVPNAAAVTRVLENIRAMGVRIAVDDFGTGYSAFSYLKQLPLNSLKIDRAFVDGIERDVDRAIAESIIAIAHKLDLSVTAEGVETRFQRRILSELGCDRLQRFDICEPLPIDRFEEFTRHRLAAS
jgi:diguanylate cyclase (GGDEF)-like protein